MYLPGNNDSVEGDYHSFQNTDGKNLFSTNTTDYWPILDKYSSNTKITDVSYNKQFGFYPANINTGTDNLKVIALNTVTPFNKGKYNKYHANDVVSQQTATRKQFEWFITTLESYKKTDRVLIMMHIPPGIDGYFGTSMWNNTLTYTDTIKKNTSSIQTAFLNKVRDHKKQIVGVLTGHTHLDGVRCLYSQSTNKKDSLMGISISTPGTTTDMEITLVLKH